MNFFRVSKSSVSNNAVQACNAAREVLVNQLVDTRRQNEELKKSVEEQQDKIYNLTQQLAAMQAAQTNSPLNINNNRKPFAGVFGDRKFGLPQRGAKRKTSRRSTRKQVRNRRS